MSQEKITILKSEYDGLRERDLWLSALENAGVDNWQGWDIAVDFLKEWKEEENKNE